MIQSTLDEKRTYTCYKLGATLYVPSYGDVTAFVGPGFGKTHNNTHSAQELLDLGATKTTEFLWKRAEK